MNKHLITSIIIALGLLALGLCIRSGLVAFSKTLQG